MPTVYVFGAGASSDAGYPLASKMGGGLLEFMLKSESRGIRGGKFLIDNFGTSPNVEDLITEIQSQIEELKNAKALEARTRRTSLGRSLAWLGIALRDWFREIHVRDAPGYAAFADKILRPGDVIITFNYDDSLERELKKCEKWDISQGYGFPLSETVRPSDVLVLKLHGSINWHMSGFGGATGGTFLLDPPSSLGEHPVVERRDWEFLGYDDFAGHIYNGGVELPCLILPGRTKEFFVPTSFGDEYKGFWDLLWSQARGALKANESIIICGYSLPTADQDARDLLLKGPHKGAHIEIISGNQTDRIASEFRGAGFSNVATFKGGYFADWCNAHRTFDGQI
jgi:hypothetical protein